MSSRLDEVLRRAEQLIKSCETWPPEQPPKTPPRLDLRTPLRGPVAQTLPQLEQSKSLDLVDAAARGPAERLPHLYTVKAAAWPPEHPPFSPREIARATAILSPRAEARAAAVLSPRAEVAREDTLSDGTSLRILSGAQTAEKRALVEGLERENALLRAQLERSAARERAAERWAGDAERAAEAAVAARHLTGAEPSCRGLQPGEPLAEPLGEPSPPERFLPAPRGQAAKGKEPDIAAAERKVLGLVKELEGLRNSLLPLAGAPDASPLPPGTSGLDAAIANADRAAADLRLACEARLDTADAAQRHLRARLEDALASAAEAAAAKVSVDSAFGDASPRSSSPASHGVPRRPGPVLRGRTPHELEGPAAALAAAVAARDEAEAERVAAKVQADGMWRAAEQAREEAVAEREQCHRLTEDLSETKVAHKGAIAEVAQLRRALRVSEAENGELRIAGRYLAGLRSAKPSGHELQLAELVEELRGRCGRLSEEASQLRAERDLLRAERALG